MAYKPIRKKILQNWRVNTKNQLFEKITDFSVKHNLVVNASLFLKELSIREEVGSTLIHDNISLPHVKSNNIQNSAILIVRLDAPLKNWDQNDTDVKVIIFMLVKENEKGNQLLQLQNVMKSFADEDTLNILLNGNKKETYKIINI